MTIRRRGERLTLEGVSATASRAIFQRVRGELPTIQFTFETVDGETVEIELPLTEASKFLQQGLDAYTAAVPETPRARQRTLN